MTAVEWLKNELWEKFNFSFSDNIFEQAKEMEKQQIIDAFDEGQEYEYQYHINNAPKFDSQTYFTETYGSKGSDENFKQFSLYEHKETITSADTITSSQTEISEEEIEEAVSEHYSPTYWDERTAFRKGVVWYREQLKKKQ